MLFRAPYTIKYWCRVAVAGLSEGSPGGFALSSLQPQPLSNYTLAGQLYSLRILYEVDMSISVPRESGMEYRTLRVIMCTATDGSP